MCSVTSSKLPTSSADADMNSSLATQLMVSSVSAILHLEPNLPADIMIYWYLEYSCPSVSMSDCFLWWCLL